MCDGWNRHSGSSFVSPSAPVEKGSWVTHHGGKRIPVGRRLSWSKALRVRCPVLGDGGQQEGVSADSRDTGGARRSGQGSAPTVPESWVPANTSHWTPPQTSPRESRVGGRRQCKAWQPRKVRGPLPPEPSPWLGRSEESPGAGGCKAAVRRRARGAPQPRLLAAPARFQQVTSPRTEWAGSLPPPSAPTPSPSACRSAVPSCRVADPTEPAFPERPALPPPQAAAGAPPLPLPPPLWASATPGWWGPRQRGPGHFRGSQGFQRGTGGRAERNNLTPEMLPQCVWAGPSPG